MKNIIEQYRQKRELTFAALGRSCGLTAAAVLRHCKGERKIGGEAALRYHIKLGIPLNELRPELFAQGSPTGITHCSSLSQKG
ncbi:helix-turn-helix transcriptional regulator [Halodesulfovibrio sp. MK-HDV]|uniref:helix-turn-helix domain-containing protein n=1 Tax=Halodesulfovibrio sp. MK-HDV TaxID=2599925 RepID=UPI001371B5A3|nr:helix-turn-helix transcriptional regulator [Halodesulfovibrio sp. MK-HDV]